MTAHAFGAYGMMNVDQLGRTISLSPVQTNTIQAIQAATVAIITKEEFKNPEHRKFGEIHRFCGRHEWEQERSFSHCSGTLIASDLVLTAGHCFRDQATCAKMKIAFDFLSDSSIEILKNNSGLVYNCKNIVAKKIPAGGWDGISLPKKDQSDYVIIRLDRSVKDRKPIAIVKQRELRPEENVYVFGHPQGLSQKVSAGFNNEKSIFNKVKNNYFQAIESLILPGFSGAGVYNSDFELMGVFVRGQSSFERDGGTRPTCGNIKECSKESCGWSHAHKLNAIPSLIKLGSLYEK